MDGLVLLTKKNYICTKTKYFYNPCGGGEDTGGGVLLPLHLPPQSEVLTAEPRFCRRLRRRGGGRDADETIAKLSGEFPPPPPAPASSLAAAVAEAAALVLLLIPFGGAADVNAVAVAKNRDRNRSVVVVGTIIGRWMKHGGAEG